MVASTQLFINNSLDITQNANVYGSYINAGNNYDYIFSINVASLCNNNMSLLFSNASFIQNTTNPGNYNINITLNNSTSYTNWESVFNNQELTQIVQGNSNVSFGTLQGTDSQSIGERFLEVIAHKIFGHGQAQAAINNDSEFYTHDALIWDHLSTTLGTTTIRNDIFNQYVASGRYQDEAETAGATVNNYDFNQWVNFNFTNLTFDFPLYLSGTILTNDTLTTNQLNILYNGPSVGGTSLTNGSYNIPILVSFHQ